MRKLKKKIFKCIFESIYAYNPKLKTFQMKKNPPIHSRSPPTKMLVPGLNVSELCITTLEKVLKTTRPTDQRSAL